MNGNIRKALAIAALAGGVLMATTTQAPAQIRTGMYGALNYNVESGSMEKFIPGIGGGPLSTNDFSDPTGIGGSAGVMGEYIIDDRVAMSLRASYDQRNTEKESNGSKLTTRLSYLTLEPAVRISMGYTPLHFVVGPVMAFKLQGTYSYDANNLAEPASDVTNGRIPNVRSVAFGGRAGFGYDFPMNRPGTMVAMFLTPFVEASYLVDQIDPVDPASTDVTSTLTARVGLQVAMQF